MARRKGTGPLMVLFFVFAALTNSGVDAALSGADITGDTDGYFFLTSTGCACCAMVTVTTTGGGTFTITKDGSDIVTEAVTQPSSSVTMPCTAFGNTPGMYTVTMTVTQGGNSHTETMVAVYEETLVGYSVTTSQVIAPPYTQITFDMAVNQGTNALFTVDCVTNIQLMKSCDGNTRTATYSQMFNDTGSHVVTTMVSNYGSKLSEVVVVTIIHNMNNVAIAIGNNKPQTTEDPGIKVTMASGAQLPMGNLTGWHTCTAGETQEVLDLSGLTAGGEVAIPCVCDTQTNKTVTVNVSTELDSIQETYEIYCWDILNITVTLDKDVQPINEVVPFNIENVPNYGIQWNIDACQNNILTNTDASSYGSTYLSKPVDLSSIIYTETGNCTFHATFWNEMYIVVLDLTFELSIGVSNLTAEPSALELLTGESFTLTVNATGLDIFWAVDFTEAMVVQSGCSGLVAEHNFTAAAIYTVEVMASNRVNNKSTSLEISVVYPINGYTVTVTAPSIQSHENLEINVALASSPNVPMGNLSVTISPCGDADSTDLLPVSAGATNNFNCNFTKQGNYSIDVTVASRVSSENFTVEAVVCDNLAITISVDKTSWAVGDSVTVTMNTLPMSGFKYRVDMGDSTTVHSNEADSVLDSLNTFTAIPAQAYSTPGTYTVSLYAYNQCYSVSSSVVLAVEYGIPPCNLVIVPNRKIVTPDDTTTFSFVTQSGTTTDNPTNVTCTWNLGDGTPVTNQLTEMDFSSSSTGYAIAHDYTTAEGTVNYQVDCENRVSNVSFSGTVDVVIVRAADFSVTFEPVTPLPEGTCTNFDITLSFHNLSAVPNNVTYKVDYGDGNGVSAETSLSTYVVSASRCKRGAFTGDLTVVYNGVSQANAVAYSLGTCSLKLVGSTLMGLVGSQSFSFTLSNHLAAEQITVTIDWKDGNTEDQTLTGGQSITVTHTFATHGSKKPSYTATTSLGNDGASLEKELYLMYPVDNLELEIPEPILLGVTIEPNIIYSGSNFLMNMTCNITYDSTTGELMTGVDLQPSPNNIATAVGNMYMAIQEETIIVICSNPLTSKKLNATFEVSSDCFLAPDIFESIHRRIDTPMRVYRSALPTLTARVKLSDKCKNTTEFDFQWTFQKQDPVTQNFEPYPMESPNMISNNLATSTIEEGFYLVQLYMKLVERENDYLQDKQYMKIVNPPLVCSIVGGDFTMLGKGEKLVLDAKTNSYDPLNGIKQESGLDYTWACYVVDNCDDAQVYTLPKSTDRSYQSKTSCGLNFQNEGYIEVDTSPLDFGKCFVFEQTISKDSRNCTTIQVVQVTEVPPCKIAMMCLKNCMEKVTPEEPTAFEVNIVCDGATKEQLDAAVYGWSLSKFDFASSLFTDIPWDSNFIRQPTDRLFELNHNFFTAGESYRLQITAEAAGRPQSKAYKTLVANETPRGGTCTISPLEGVFLNTTFSVLCDGWMDEGIRNEKDDAVDIQEPLKLKILQDGNLISLTDFTRKVSHSAVDLKVGTEQNNFDTVVEMIILDAFGGKAAFNQTVKVENSMPPVPAFGTAAASSNLTQEEKEQQETVFNNFLQSAEDSVSFSAGNGAPLDTAVVIASYAQSINSVTFPTVSSDDVTQVTNENADAELSRTLEAGTQVNPMLEKIQGVNEVFVASLRDGIENELQQLANSSKTPSAATIITFASSLATVVAEPTLLNGDTIGSAGESLSMLASVMAAVANSTLSTVAVEQMQGAVGSLLSNVIHCNNYFAVTGVEVDGADRFDNSTDKDEGFNPVEADYLQKLLKSKKEIQLKQATDQLNQNIKSILSAANNMYKLASGLTTEQSSNVVEEETFIQSVQKDTANNIINSSKGVNGSTLAVDSVVGIDPEDIIENNLVVLKENPFITGPNAKMAEYPVTMASMTKNGKKIQLKGAVVSQTDPVEAPYVFYRDPKFTPGDPGYMLYHPFLYRASSEQICITSKPVNESVCYDVCLRALIPPTEFEYDHCDRNVTGNIGLEYCAPPGGCKRTGTCWLGIIPFACEASGSDQGHRRARRSASANDTGAPVSSSVTDQGGDANSTDPLLTPYNLRIVTLSCLSWDGGEQDWDASVCKVTRDPVNNKTMCKCGDKEDVITTVSFFVAPNTIDFSTVFSKFDIAGQGAVLGTILVCFVLFVIFLFWGRYMDGQDVLQWGVTLMADNYKGDSYYYLLTIHTGMVRHGGTQSKIGFCIAGEDEDTGVRMLSDGVREEMKAGSTMHFLMAVPQCLGTLQCFRVWHDNSGKGDSASWYLNRVEVTDLQTADKYDFLCYQWMSLEEGTLDKALALSSTENMKNFKTMFFEHARHHLTDDHLWVSVLLRPVKSHFSRVQRVGCCYTLLMLAMISNAMFFQSKENKDRKQSSDFSIGPISFSLSQIYISFISTIITAIPVFFIMLLFRKSKLSEKATKDGTRLWMPHCFRKFKFYKQSKAIEKIMVIRDIVDDQDGVLPHFCVYISWVFAFICVFLSAFFIMLYSMEWGKDISEEWLVTFILSFFESLIIMDPVKVLVLAILFAILLKTLKASKPSHFDLNHIGRMNRENGQHGEGRARLDYRSPFSEEELQRAKLQCRRRNTIRKAIQELLANSFFLWLLASISYSNRDPHGFLLHQNIKNTFMEPFKPAITLEHVNTSAHYFKWLDETVIPNLFPTNNFNGSRLTPNMRLRIGDLSNYRVGAPRLRQVRQAEKTCTIPFVGKTQCYPEYDLATEENRDFCKRWRQQSKCPENEALAVTNAAWTFVSALDIWGLPITGQRAVYGGGGYIAELDINRQVAEMAYQELFESRWIDRNTRGVFLEFTLYNANKNMFCYVSILAEFPESGGVLEFTNVFPFRSFNHIGTVGKYILFCEIVFFIFTILWLGYISFKLMKERWCFFKSFWNVVELASVIISFIAVILYFIRLTYTNEAMALFKENDRVFINFYHIAVWDNLFVYALGFLVGIATLRLLRVMGYSRVTQIVYLVLKESSKTLPGFFFYILLILSAYGFLGQIVFGSNALAYKDFITTMETLFSAVLGHAGFRNTNVPVSDSWISLIYFVSFILIVVFALSNIFMTILLDTMSLVGDDPKNLNYKEIELFAYMWDSAKTLITGKKEPTGLDTTKPGPGLYDNTDEPYAAGNFGLGDAHDRKMQMKMDLAAAFNASVKPAYKY
ncbi:uncharacterized protein LOC124132273 isoform X1 [Haliotis rufescens]|uniref:uncharacterized protein LOC124132273 isoform X1 n=1 Tax=Haliotis rufescens TaxID=6454 RepID=UPI00201F7F37|nr:uncharacterized protein LOC124132273 isoform X1 [Haliotis rufescens]